MNIKHLATLAALSLVPVSATALTVDATSNLASGHTYDIGNGPFFWGASFTGNDEAGSVWFRFENSNPGAVNVSGDVVGTLLQFTGSFEYLTAAWLSGESVSFASGLTTVFGLSTLLLAGGEDTLSLSWGAVDGQRADIDFGVDVSAVPIPAGFGLLAAGLAGMGVIGRRKQA